MSNKEIVKRLRKYLKQAEHYGDELGYVYEDVDLDTDGRVIHNLTITWKETEPPS